LRCEQVNVKDLIDLTELSLDKTGNIGTKGAQGIYPSCGGCDEFLKLYAYRKTVSMVTLPAFALFASHRQYRDHGEGGSTAAAVATVIPTAAIWGERVAREGSKGVERKGGRRMILHQCTALG
jgi:hypothetical protein